MNMWTRPGPLLSAALLLAGCGRARAPHKLQAAAHDDAATREREVEVVDQDALAVGLAQAVRLDHRVAQPKPNVPIA